MQTNRKSRVSWGSVAAYAFFGLYIALVGVGGALRWHALDIALEVLAGVILVAGSAAVMWRARRRRGEPGGPRLGQSAALPRSWRKWMLGERNSDEPDH